MIKLLQNKLVRGALFALIAGVMVFGVFFLSPHRVEAQTEAEVTAFISENIKLEWLEQTDLANTSFKQRGGIIIDNQGELIPYTGNPSPTPEHYENSFLSNDGLIGVTINDFYFNASGIKIRMTDENGNTKLVPPQGGILQLAHTSSDPITRRTFTALPGGLEPGTTYTLQAYIRLTTYYEGPTDWFNIDIGDELVIKTLTDEESAEAGVEGETETQILSGQTGFDSVVNDTLKCSYIKAKTWGGCFVQFLNNTVYPITVAIITAAAQLFDILISLAISSKVYRDSTFVISGWSIVRDIANIFFIFVLLIAAFKTIFGSNEVQKTIKNVIIVALLINFSLFMVRVVIDSTNVLSHMIYNRINASGQENISNIKADLTLRNVGEQRDISKGIAYGLSIQNLTSGDAVVAFLKTHGTNALAPVATIVVFGIILNLIAAWMFFKVGWMMLGRIIGLWMSMILSPLAFILKLIPGAAEYIPDFSFRSWSKDLIQYALLAPVFLFFLMLIIMFINSNFISVSFLNPTDYDSFQQIIVLALGFAIIIALLQVATDTAKKMSGKAGQMISGAATKAFGMAAGVAGGAVMATGGLALRQTAGRGMKALGDSEWLKDAEEKGGPGGWLAAKARDAGKYGGTASWDARSGVIGKGLGSGLDALGVKGVNFDNQAVGAFGGSVKSGQGGFTGAREDASKAAIARAKELKDRPDSQIDMDVYKARKDLARIQAAKDREKFDNGEGTPEYAEIVNQETVAKEVFDRANTAKKLRDREGTLDFADAVENSAIHRGIKTGASETADKLRKVEKSDAEKIAEMLKKKDKDDKPKDDEVKTVAGLGKQQREEAGLPTSVGRSNIGDNPNIQKVIDSSRTQQVNPGGQFVTGQGPNKPVGGFGQGLEEMKAAKKEAARSNARENLGKRRNPGQYVAQETTERYARRYGDMAAKERFKDTSGGEDFEYSAQTRRGGKTRAQAEAEQKAKAGVETKPVTEIKPAEVAPIKAEPVEVKLDTSDLNLGEELKGVEEALGEGLKNVGEGLKTSAEITGKEIGDLKVVHSETTKKSDTARSIEALRQRKATAKAGDTVAKSINNQAKGDSQKNKRNHEEEPDEAA